MVMNGLQYGKYTFTCKLDAPAILPEYKGSTFRGVFGIALKKVVCALRQRECKSCLLRQRCLYTRVFETPIALAPPDGLRMTVPPHPFVIQPPDNLKREFDAGESLNCNLLLFGPVNESLPYFIYAFEQIGKIGIGKKMEGHRAGFRLDKVCADSHVIYSGHDEKIALNNPADAISITGESHSQDAVLRVKVTIETPLRLKFQNQIKADLPFHVLIRAMLRRISSLFTCYAGAEPDIDYKGLLEMATGIRAMESRLRWHAWERYSNRQKQRMPLGGMVGSVVYEGKLSEYISLMEFCSKVHLGKNTTFGLGKLGLTVLS